MRGHNFTKHLMPNPAWMELLPTAAKCFFVFLLINPFNNFLPVSKSVTDSPLWPDSCDIYVRRNNNTQKDQKFYYLHLPSLSCSLKWKLLNFHPLNMRFLKFVSKTRCQNWDFGSKSKTHNKLDLLSNTFQLRHFKWLFRTWQRQNGFSVVKYYILQGA